jgi:hypothetical protein
MLGSVGYVEIEKIMTLKKVQNNTIENVTGSV